MTKRIITISREFGSGGRTIGREVAARLGIPCYDQEIIDEIAEKSGLARDYISEHGEYVSSAGWWGSLLGSRDYYGNSPQDTLWSIQSRVILDLAEKGPCVIVGRCADHLLKGKADCLTVFIHASLEKRAERIVHVYGESSEAPEKRLRDKDRRRKAYYQMYTDTEWGLAANYDLALDSGTLGIESCVDIIAGLF
ncbi:MAG: cytidylate kinase-like family protein [Oscillospiraceae bacterium]|nr:cytidylate kinase-like family protein [Oscillospiraceae bacterium]